MVQPKPHENEVSNTEGSI